MLSLAAYLHDIDPFVFRIGDGLGVRWYGLSYILGFVIAWLLIRRVASTGRSTLDPRRAADLVFALALGVVLGGRLGYVLFYDRSLLVDFSNAPPFWGVLAINRGGMASHGGILGAVLAAWVFARRTRQPLAHILDLAAFATPLGLFSGRIANFINGELYGRPCDPAYPLAVQFPQEMHYWSAGQWQRFADAARLDLGELGIDRIVELVRRGDPVFAPAAQAVLTPRHPSQLYQALLEGLTLMLILLIVWWKPRKPLVLGGWFLCGYAVLRIVGEVFRMPDAHIAHQEFARLHVTRGQLLSAGLLAAGLVMLIAARRRDAKPLGGWRRQRDPS